MFLVFIILRPIRLRVGVMASYDICPNLQVLSLLQYFLQFHGFVGGDEVHTLTYQHFMSLGSFTVQAFTFMPKSCDSLIHSGCFLNTLKW